MRYFAALAAFAVLFDTAAATKWLPTRTVKNEARSNAASSTAPPSPFVTVNGANFMKNGKPVSFAAVDAYWLGQMTDENINATMKDIASKNISLVRTWAFNDVSEVPETGAWFQLLAPNGTRIFNNGTNGAGRLRSILNAANANNLMVQFVLTNNWSANNISNITITLANGTKVNNPRGSYSNDYGGADTYVQFQNLTDHGMFFTNQNVITTFMDGLTDMIPQFASDANLLSWEIANDPRCNGTLTDPKFAGQCTTTSVTLWHSQVANHIRSLDPNHLIASGSQGFLCSIPSQCPKSFFTQTPAPVVSPTPGLQRRSLTEKSILAERNARWRRTAAAAKQQWDNAAEKRARGVLGGWAPRSLFGREAAANPVPAAAPQYKKRQSMTLGSSMDGSFGVDTVDIGAIPNIGYTTFQFIPDQNVYEPADPNLSALNNTINAGIQWIQAQAAVGRMIGKPTFLTNFGTVTQNNAPFFIPFNGTTLTFPNASAVPTTLTGPEVGILQGQAPLNETDQAIVYQNVLQAAIANSISALTVHQWGQAQLQPAPTPTQGLANAPSGTFVPDLPATQGLSPNDGYQAISPQIQTVIQSVAINLQLAHEITIPSV